MKFPGIARSRDEADDNRMRALLAVPLLAAIASPAHADGAAAQAQLLRQQLSDAFALQLQQSVPVVPRRAARAGAPARARVAAARRASAKSDTFWQPGAMTQPRHARRGRIPPRRLMRFEQERALELDRAREAAASAADRSRPPPPPAPNPEPAVVWEPVLR
jgi:hypothetical protein